MGSHENILIWNFFQLHIIEITVDVLPIMTSYLAIGTSLLVLQRYLSAIRLYTCSILSSITRPLQHQCYPGNAIRDKDSCESHSQLIKPCARLRSHAFQWLQLRMRMTALYNNNNYEPRLILPYDRNWARTLWFHVEAKHHHTIFSWNIASRSNK